MTTKNETEKAPAPRQEMTAAERKAAVDKALAELAKTTDRNAQKGIRARLRRLGHVGGLRAVNGAKVTAKKGAKAPVKGGVKKGKAPVKAPHPLSNTKAAKAARKAIAQGAPVAAPEAPAADATPSS